jgi:hypothetical protein
MIYSNQYNSLKWNYKNADWNGFTNACDIKFSCNMVSDNIQETNTTLTNELINIGGDFFFFFIIFEILPPTSMTGPVSSLVPLSNKFCTILIPPWDTWLLIFIVDVDQKSTHGSDHFVVNIKISYKPMIYSNQ